MSEEATGAQGADNQGGNDQGHGQTEQQGANDAGRAGSDANLLADLANERKARQAAASEAKKLQERLEALEAQSKTEAEKAVDRARKEGLAEATKAANARLARMQVRMAAADRLADPSDADVIDVASIPVDDDGNVDPKAVTHAIDQLLKDKPHWAKQQQQGSGSADQGARGGQSKPKDMNSMIRAQVGR